jgi:hypothetical protein
MSWSPDIPCTDKIYYVRVSFEVGDGRGCPRRGRRSRWPWLLAQKPWIVPIPGTTKLHRLEENIGVAHVVLTLDDLRDIESAAGKISLKGERYPEAMEQLAGR